MTVQKHYVKLQNGSDRPVSIFLIGAGGTGSQVISGLARMNRTLVSLGHPGLHLAVCDGDTVSASNVGRQLFSEADIGRNKATVLVSRVNMFFGTVWSVYPYSVNENTNIGSSQPRIVISAVDSAKTRVAIFKAMTGRKGWGGTYWLDTGNTQSTGQVILGTTAPFKQPKACAEYLPHVIDLYKDIEGEDKKAYQGPSCSVEAAIRKQDLFVNQWIATCALEILWKMFRKGYLTVHGAFVNLDSFKVRPLPIDPTVWKSMGWEKPMEEPKKKGRKKP
ncbi:MAG: PRTRC system ThiF family protein [Syntrophorhabdaceae bacterium]|nr:PRTRC system ThiF family protein [Syntrophorhabdaceae bacterium]